jgi:thiamine pyrophosphate-dependent acetolactate synthase large subunit-like protein
MIDSEQMSLVDALRVLKAVRTDRQLFIPTMGSAREWMTLGTHLLDFIYAPSAMGQAPNLGLGIALAQPDRQVIVGNGDGCMLMNLGSLVTITAEAPPNYVLIVFENGVYEVTGQQVTAGGAKARRGESRIDLCAVARGSGFTSVYEFRTVEAWRQEIDEVLAARGPTFVLLHVAPVTGGAVPRSPAPPIERAEAFAKALQGRG